MLCKKCGKAIEDGVGSCRYCGTMLAPERKEASGKLKGTAFFSAPDLSGDKRRKETAEMKKGSPELRVNFGKKKTLSSKSAAVLPPAHKKAYRVGNNFNRSPRLINELNREIIKIQAPPAIGTKPEINWLTVLLPPVAMAFVFILISFLSGGASTYLFFMIPMQLISVLVSIITYRQQTKKHEKTVQLRESKYRAYLDKIYNRLCAENDRQKQILLQTNSSMQGCVATVQKQTKRLWERRPEDSDFGSFRVGIGSVPAKVTATWEENELSLEEDALEKEAANVANTNRFVDEVPIVVPSDSRIIGVVGDRDSSIQLAKNCIVQLSVFHSYEDLKFAVVFPEDEKQSWYWARWLPHVSDGDNDLRLIASTQSAASILKEKLTDLIQQRRHDLKEGRYSSAVTVPQYILFLAAPDLLWSNELFAEIAAQNLNIRVVCLSQNVSLLPKECDHIIEIGSNVGRLYRRDKAAEQTAFVPDSMMEEEYERLSRMMAAIHISSAKSANAIPKSISFFEGYGIKRIEDYDLGSAWRKTDVSRSLAVPIGIDESGNRFMFDICDGKHGVHGLVGGMPGSGKSEMLQSWLLSLAMNFSPEEISFILIDFKGTGLITPFVGLPHLAGTISNIDTDIKRNKESLEFELERRERLFDEAGVSNIRDYLRLYRNGYVKDPLPILIVVIDEFAEFRKAFPEFMKWVESSFTKGRSEGVWFVLATQQPGSQASEAIKSNTHFKWCLKVASTSASKEMVGIPDAAQITRPGRAFVRVSNSTADFLTQVQSFWSGAPYRMGDSEDANNRKIAIVDLNGNRQYFSDTANPTGYKTDRTEIEVAVAYITAYAKENGIPSAAKVWEEKLAERLALPDICTEGFDGSSWPAEKTGLSVPIGEADDPQHQQKYLMSVPFSELGHIEVLGAPATGKTTFLKTLITSAALRYSPEELNIYIMDFGSLSMRVFSAMPHVGGIVEMGQDERIAKLAGMLREELERRKRLFADEGVSTMEEYRKATDKKLPYIILAVDNINVVLPTYPELDSFFLSLLQNGTSYGVYLAVAATGTNGVSYKYQPSIKMAYALQLTDKSEYSSIVGKTNGLVPEPFMGRGLVRGTPPLQFQTALPTDGDTDIEITAGLKRLAEQMCGAWGGMRAKQIPELPEVIAYGSVDCDGICLGLSCSKVEPVIYRYQEQHCLLISGGPRSGKSDLLWTIAKQFKDQRSAAVYSLDITGNSRRAAGEICDKYLSDAAQIDSFFDELMPQIKQRQDSCESAAQVGQTIIITVDDYAEFFRAVNEKTIRRMLAINKLAAGLGVYLVVACAAQELSLMRSRGEGLASALLLEKQAVLLGGCINDHPAFQLKLPYAKKSIDVKDTEGFYVNGGQVTSFRTMSSEVIA